MQVRLASIIAGTMLTGMVLGGCSSGSSSDPTQAPASDPLAPGTAAAVAIRNYAFEPAEVEVESETPVLWTVGEGTHEVIATDGAQFDSGPLAAGDTFTWAPDFAGNRTISYQCKIHPDQMQGTITVNG